MHRRILIDMLRSVNSPRGALVLFFMTCSVVFMSCRRVVIFDEENLATNEVIKEEVRRYSRMIRNIRLFVESDLKI